MENKVNEAYLILGTNIGKRTENLAAAQKEIEENIGSVQKLSAVYETEPWGISNQPAFYNQVILVHTTLSALQVLACIHRIEHGMGRVRKEKYGARIIDIDILFFNNEVHNTEQLIIPHPRITERNFVLAPLAEIAGHFIHPVSKLPVNRLLELSRDPLRAVRVAGTTFQDPGSDFRL